MTTFLIVLVLIASVLLVLAVLVQNPKSGMASNFGASNQIMGVRQTTDFLEKFTWGTATVILVLSLIITISIGGSKQNSQVSAAKEAVSDQKSSGEGTDAANALTNPGSTAGTDANTTSNTESSK